MRELEDILKDIEKPLHFASKNSYQHLHNIKGLESTIQRIVSSQFQGNSHADRLMPIVEKIRGFDSQSLDRKREIVAAVLSVISGIREQNNQKEGGPVDSGQTSVVPSSFNHASARKALSTPIQFIRGVGPKLAELLAKKGIRTVEDALYFVPRGYQDRREIRKIAKVSIGSVETVVGEVMSAEVVGFRGGRKRIFEVMVGDGSGFLVAKWFHFNQRYMKGRFKKGERLIMTGEVKGFGGQREMHHPDVEPFDDTDKLNFGRIVPLYSLTEGLGEKTIRKIMHQAVSGYVDYVIDPLPADIMHRNRLIPLREAVEGVHFPGSGEDISSLQTGAAQSRRRLVFDEFFLLELGLALRQKGLALEKGIRMTGNGTLTGRLEGIIPFSLTSAQKRVIEEIRKDMSSEHPMNRLVQGDVGCGKTLVAFFAVLFAVESGYQAVIMAPTELLAEQHFLNIHVHAEALGIRVALLTGGIKGKEREAMMSGVRAGAIDLIIGTHAVIQEGLEFSSLGLAVIDEQHRFGVVQRGALKKKGENPHILVMTATPIPRTLAMTVYGDLSLSVIDEMPPGRSPVLTKIYGEKEREKVYSLIEKEIREGRQAYIVYPLVEESEKSDLMDATNMAEEIRERFPEFRIGLLHGRMKAEEKEMEMKAFKARDTDILVATTVIEVGIDVPNASIMMIEHAERFGLSQLHQLRGRVGRGSHKSYCLLLAQYRRSEEAWKRLKIMESSNDGFRIAEADLEIRGPGDFIGTRQAGMPDMRVGNIVRDVRVLEEARREAFSLIEKDPHLKDHENMILKEYLRERWKGRLELASIA